MRGERFQTGHFAMSIYAQVKRPFAAVSSDQKTDNVTLAPADHIARIWIAELMLVNTPLQHHSSIG